jgi:hypothetical protein
MATIKFKRGSGQPTGLTAYEPAWDTANGRFFINDGSTAVWIGARIDNNTSLAGNCAFAVPTQNAVKTYVDNQVAGGAVSSIDGVTGAVDLIAGSGLSITNPTGSGKGITLTNIGVLSVNGSTGTITNIAVTNAAQTFTGLQTFTNGISAFGVTASYVRSNIGQSLSLASPNTSTASIGIFGAATDALSSIQLKAKIVDLGIGSEKGSVRFNDGDGNYGTLVAPNLAADRTYTFPDATGTIALSENVVTSLVAGTGIQVSSGTGAVTVTNIGVQSLSGTANQITASGSTGAVTLSLPSAVTMPGSLTVTGNLVVNGTTTTVNSTSVVVQDPIISIGGLTNGAPPVSGDVKDRGVAFQYYSTAGRTGFFGHDTSTGRFTYIPVTTSITSEVVSGTAGSAELAGVYGPQRTLVLSGISGAEVPSTITLTSGSLSSTATYFADTHSFSSNGGSSVIKLAGDIGVFSTIASEATTTDKTFTIPDFSGFAVVANSAGATSGWILRAAGPTTVNSWINPTASGFTAFASTNADKLLISGTKTSGTYGVAFALGTGYRDVFIDSNNDITWNTATNTLTVGAGSGKLEGIVDGGGF